MDTKKRKGGRKSPEREVAVDLGLGGLFKGLGEFIDLVSDMAEKGQETVTRSGEFRVRGLGDKGRAVYGFTVGLGTRGIPRVERFGNIQAGAEGPEVADVREPLVDVFDEGDTVVLVAELPGVAEGDIQVDIEGDVISLETTGERKYAKEALLPSVVDSATLERTYRNGILELRVKKV
ncbi:MAG: Hsp20/alpha crystallin family protein [Armatimonadetes bacterium]|nr:Hsp20/alpha crystallin family protein [Armatimonadota bacterium]